MIASKYFPAKFLLFTKGRKVATVEKHIRHYLDQVIKLIPPVTGQTHVRLQSEKHSITLAVFWPKRIAQV